MTEPQVSTLDPEGLLQDLSVAIDDDETPSPQDLERARALLRQPGGIAYAYALVDQAVLAAEATGATAPERFVDSPLASLLADVCEEEWEWEEAAGSGPRLVHDDAPNTARPTASNAPSNASPKEEQRLTPAANDDDENGPGAKIIRLFGPATALLAAAAAILFFVRPADEGPGVKGIVAAPMVAEVVARDGPLSSTAAIDGLRTVQKQLDACGVAAPAVVDVGFAISGEGVVDRTGDDAIKTTVVSGDVSGAQSRCLKNAVSQAAFGFERAPTLVMMRLTFRPKDGSS